MISAKRAWEIVEAAKTGDKASRLFDVSILTLIFLGSSVFSVGKRVCPATIRA